MSLQVAKSVQFQVIVSVQYHQSMEEVLTMEDSTKILKMMVHREVHNGIRIVVLLMMLIKDHQWADNLVTMMLTTQPLDNSHLT